MARHRSFSLFWWARTYAATLAAIQVLLHAACQRTTCQNNLASRDNGTAAIQNRLTAQAKICSNTAMDNVNLLESLNDEQLMTLHLHDATIKTVTVGYGPDTLGALIEFTPHEDERDYFLRDGFSASSLTLIFYICHRIIANNFALTSRNETLDSWEVVNNSELIETLVTQQLISSAQHITHYSITTVSGSRFDILAEKVNIASASSKK